MPDDLASAAIDNPYAAPQTAEAPVSVPEEMHGVPMSVRLSIGSLCLFALPVAWNLIAPWIRGGFVMFQPHVLPAALTATVLIALWRRWRWVRPITRLLTFGGALLISAYWAFMINAFYITDDAVFAGTTGPNPTVSPASVWRIKLGITLYAGFLTACMWIPAIALGRRSARRYFDPEVWQGKFEPVNQGP